MPGLQLENRVAIVTGSSSGIGREICHQFHLEGASIVCADLASSGKGPGNETATHEDIQKLGGKAIFVKTNIAEVDEVKALIARAVDEYGRLDIMVNNAAICTEPADPKPINETDEDVFDAHMNVNVRGTFLCSKYAVQQMKKQEAYPSGLRGWVVNIASLYSLVALAGLNSYVASKGAVAAMTRCMALDCGKQGIVCNAICPGYTTTALLHQMAPEAQKALAAEVPRGRLGTPKDQARAAVFLASDDAAWITGITLSVDGGVSAQ